jgi:serine/threonine-protein kinase
MPVLLICPQGHTWELANDPAQPTMTGPPLCPTCGGPGRPADAPDQPIPSVETLPIVNRPDGPASPADDRPQVEGYEVLGELGRGGMGVVYQARQQGLNRLVALKMILAGTHAGPQELARFRIEAEAVAQLQHPNIVQIYEVGEHGRCPYFSLEFVDGGSLDKKANGSPLPPRQAAELIATVARAMHAAHQRGIVHRDLKPGNILLTADGVPKITDFGLAKRLDSQQGQTASGAVMGTPSYMAPEQAGGRSKEIGPAVDVYALGAILYEMLTGRPPFRAESALETLVQVVEQDPAPPRLLSPKVERDLETVCLKCLEKEPAHRYASAAALAEDLEHYLNGEAISASSFNLLDRLAQTLDRSKHAVEFAGWGNMLVLFGVLVLVGHLTTFALVETGQADVYCWLARFVQFGVMAAVFWRYRPRTLMPTSAAERQLWSIWIGYLVAYGVSVMASRMLFRHHILAHDPTTPERWGELIFYPTSAILSGLAFFIMGSNYWGRCYAVGLAFMGLALVMPLRLAWAPVEFGLAWCVALVSFGLHLRRLGREAGGAEGALKRH